MIESDLLATTFISASTRLSAISADKPLPSARNFGFFLKLKGK
jgi:hypothetical protein